MFYAISAFGRGVIWLKWLRLGKLVIPYRILVYVSAATTIIAGVIGSVWGIASLMLWALGI